MKGITTALTRTGNSAALHYQPVMRGVKTHQYYWRERRGTMTTDLRLIQLRRVLFVKTIVTIFIWGLPALIGPLSVLAILGIPIPEDPIYLRLFGGACTAWGVAYWFAYKDPLRNVAIVKAGLVDNALPTLVIVFLGVTGQVSSVFILISGLLTGIFFVLFLLLMPRVERSVTG